MNKLEVFARQDFSQLCNWEKHYNNVEDVYFVCSIWFTEGRIE